MKQIHENYFEKLRELTIQISELSKQLQTMREETLAALISDNAFGEARKRVCDQFILQGK